MQSKEGIERRDLSPNSVVQHEELVKESTYDQFKKKKQNKTTGLRIIIDRQKYMAVLSW